MSDQPHREPTAVTDAGPSPVATIIDGRPRDLGGFTVRRLLPSSARRLVGPFIFFDHMGPAAFAPGQGVDVRPHPHIGLATVTYLYQGEIVHRDSLGCHQPIRPGAINWMTAGRGIVHSERTDPALRATGSPLHGLQLWVALPLTHEETEPSFHHHPAESLPTFDHAGARLRVLAGAAYGQRAPIQILSPLFYVDATLPLGCELPVPADHEERAVYVVEGEITCGETPAGPGRMLVLSPGAPAVVRASSAARIALIGGAPIDAPRHIWWNFVSSSETRMEQAKRDWKEGRFAKVPGDEHEHIPLPE